MTGPVANSRSQLPAAGRRTLVFCLAAIAFVIVALVAFRALAWGGSGEILRVRFGGDSERTRVVIDLEQTTRGQVIEAADGSTRFVLALTGIGPGDSPRGAGLGLVRQYEVDSVAGASRLRLTLTRPAEIERRFLLPPGDGVDHYRYVIDLKAPAGAAPAVVQVAAAPEPPPPPRPRLIVIDPGHGGRDPGAMGAQSRESAITLAAAQALKAELERSGRYRVLLTRTADVYIPHDRRVAIAREADADLFISLHADAGADATTRGASVYTLSEQGAERAVRQVTGRQDWTRDMQLPGADPSVDRILLDLTQRATQNRSAQFARNLLGELERAEHPMLQRSHRDGNLIVLLAPDVPAVLLEMGFITNPDDEALLGDERRRRRLMRAVSEAIDGYFSGAPGPITVASR